MTRRAAGSGRGIPRIWLLPIVGVTAILGTTAAGVLSRSLVLDLLAWWPVWTFLAILVVVVRGRRIGKVRVSGLMPLIVTVALAVFVVGHLVGWPIMPSTTQVLVGPAVEASTAASLSARIEGDVHLSTGSDFLYEVRSVRRGGDIGIPNATEETEEDVVSVALEPPAEPGFYSFAGWDIRLNESLTWTIVLGGKIIADLGSLEVTGLQLEGRGTVTLSQAVGPTPIDVDGAFTLLVPAGVRLRVVGEATVPDSWEQLTDGWRSPTPGDGWLVSLTKGSLLTVSEELQ